MKKVIIKIIKKIVSFFDKKYFFIFKYIYIDNLLNININIFVYY